MGLIYDVSKLISEDKLSELGGNKFNQFREQLQGPSAITKMARKAVMSYPVIISEGVIASDENLVNAVCKYLETHYAVFTMIAMSLDPVLDGVDPRSKLLKFYSEENEEVTTDEQPNAVLEIVTTEKIVVPEEYYKPYNETKEDADSENQELIDRINEKNKSKEEEEKRLKEEKENPLKKYGVPGKGPLAVDDQGKFVKIPSSSNYITKIIEKTRLSEPTIINVKFKMASNDTDIEFPVAVKANPNYISNIESAQIFSYLKENKPLVNLVKLLSGEISLFKDILFQVDKAKEDKRLYARLGRHPWFRQLLIRKNSFKIMNFLKGVILGKKAETNIMPICSLVVTKDEIERGLNDVWDRIKEKEYKNIVDKLMLLSFCVVDTTTNTIEISFYGFKNNTIMRVDHMIKDYSHSSGDKSSKDFEKLLQALIYKM